MLTIDQAISRAKKATRQGKFAVAVDIYAGVLQQQPDHPVAKKALRKLQKKLPPSPTQEQITALNKLYHTGQMTLAERSCHELLSDFPASLNVINVLGAALQVQGKYQEAVQAFDRAIELKPDFAEAHSNRGNALKEQGQLQSAVTSYEKAIQIKPDFADAYFNRGNALKDLGQLEQAIESYDKTLVLRPDFTAAHRNLSALKTYRAGDPQIAAMDSLYESLGTDSAGRTELCFALAKAHEDLADYDRSFGFLEEGNRLRKKELNYKIDDDKNAFASIKEMFETGPPTDSHAPHKAASPQAIFIVGMMRSGTSLVEQILASHSKVYAAGELETFNELVSPIVFGRPGQDVGKTGDALSADAIGRIRGAYLESLLALQAPERFVTDKMPLNFRWIGFILAALPEAKVIHVGRDAMATCWSNYKHYFPAAGNGYAYDLSDLLEFYGLYAELMSFWRERFPNKIYDIDYERLTENQEGETRKLLAFCDLEWEPQCLDFHKTKRAVKTTSAAQVRQAMYRGSSDAWKQYAEKLQPLLDGLGYRGK